MILSSCRPGRLTYHCFCQPGRLTYHLLTEIVDRALNEDIGSGDITTLSVIDPDLIGRGYIRIKEKGLIAGLPVAAAVFQRLDQEILFTP